MPQSDPVSVTSTPPVNSRAEQECGQRVGEARFECRLHTSSVMFAG